VQIHGNGLEIVIFAGNTFLDIVSRYNLYCGGGAMPPLWGLGFWHRVHARINAEQINTEVELFEKKDFPLDVIGLEPGWQTKSYPCTFEWQKKRFPDPRGFARGLLDKGIRLNLWENPYISPESRIYKEMYPLSGSHMVWLGIVPDYTFAEARKLLTDQHAQDHISIGVSGYKIDEVDGYDQWLWPDHATFPSGISAEIMRQSYGLMMQQMLYHDLFKERNIRTYGLVRASNGAASGYPFAIYSDSYSHSQYITGLSSASLCGILWTPEARNARIGREWLNRMQTVCFSPLAQLNAWSSNKKPWSYDDVIDPVREVIKIRMRLIPYFYTAFANYYLKGIPPVRAMILEEALSNNEFVNTTDQFMFGPSILVAPFYENNDTKRDVKLPPGNWYDFYTGEKVGNGTTITVTAKDLGNKIPLYVKEGAIIPMLTKSVRCTDRAYGCPLEVRVYGNSKGSYDLYEDDGKTFDYQKGKFRIRKIFTRKDKMGKLHLTEQIEQNECRPMFGAIENIRFMSK
jgi:alpha-D-xyloside xylohydrolase